MLTNISRQISQLGINPRMFIRFFRGLPTIISDYIQISKTNNHQLFPIKNKFLIINDLYEESGVANGHYFHQDLLVARKIYQANPKRHVDISSRVDGFVAHVCVFREIEVFDIRPLDNKVDGIIFRQANLMDLDEKYIEYCDSISCLHAIEHFGLGRYGDPIDVDGHLKGLENIYKILKKGGKFYFSVPVGPQRIEFNAHRVFSIGYLLSIFEPEYDIIQFSYVDDTGDLHENIPLVEKDIINNYGLNYGCGIFELQKK